MSGHSKWSQIKRQKGVTDAKRGQVFTKLAKIITVAAKQGGGDPVMNPSLRVAIEQARAENLPKDNIDRAIKRGTGELGGAAIEELRYEVYGPGGVAIVIDAATDNPNRSTAEVKTTLNKHGGKLATAGAVAFQFAHRGVLTVPKQDQPIDPGNLELEIMDVCPEAYEELSDAFVIYVEPDALQTAQKVLKQKSIKFTEAILAWEPIQTIALTDPNLAKQTLRLIEALEDLDDVTSVTANFDMPDELLSSIS